MTKKPQTITEAVSTKVEAGRVNAPAMAAYVKKLENGPVTREDIAGHKHLLKAIKEAKHALDILQRRMPSRALSAEMDIMTKDIDAALDLLEWPIALTAKPTDPNDDLIKMYNLMK